MTTTEKTTTILTPAQFLAARALAQAYSHLWGSVPDGVYNVDEIEKLFSSPGEIGITAPWIGPEKLWNEVVHTTGSGRLSWGIDEIGTVTLTVNRPNPEQQRINDALSEKLEQSWRVSAGHEVASLTIFNKIVDVHDIGSRDEYALGEVELGSSDYQKTHDADGNVSDGWNYYPPEDKLRDDLLFERHVCALIRPLVALLTVNDPEPVGENIPDWDYDRSLVDPIYASQADGMRERNAVRHQTWRASIIEPAIARAKEILAPLFEIALPDPVTWYMDQPDTDPLPETYWGTKQVDDMRLHPSGGMSCYGDKLLMEVHHNGELFPVESEKTAVHAVLLLLKTPELALIDAVKLAIQSSVYRPD